MIFCFFFLAFAIIICFSKGGVCKIKKDLTGKVVFITGANSGIGKVTALELGKMGATVILACRDTTIGETFLKKLVLNVVIKLSITQAFLLTLDTSDPYSIRQCVKDFKKLNIQIDILINNTGIYHGNEQKINYSKLKGINYLGHFLLSELLSPYLSKSARVINAQTYTCNLKKLDFLMQSRIAKLWVKISNKPDILRCGGLFISHGMEFSNRHHVKGCSLNSGSSIKGLVNVNNNFLAYLFTHFLALFAKNNFQGAQTTLHCVLDDSLVDGGYYSECKIKTPRYVNKQLAKRIWNISYELMRPYMY